jgi:mannan endo-1,4-beta-mannosidase
MPLHADRLFLLFVFLVGPAVPGLASDAVPADRQASASTRVVFNYLASLPQKKDKKLLSGQFVSGHPTVTLATVEKIHEVSGKWVALLGFDYYPPKSVKRSLSEEQKPPRWQVVNPLAKEHWKAGGLVTISQHMTNPWTGATPWSKAGNLAELLDATTPAGAFYQRQLAMIADGLDDLQQAGIVVLYRPFHEVNGAWFWWGNKDPEAFRQLWRGLFQYLTVQRKLHNLIWIYNSGSMAHYPGDDYVDIVSFDLYNDDPAKARPIYEEQIKTGKPFALAEYGPGRSTKVRAPLNYDYGPFAQRVQAALPGTVYFLSWAGPWGLDANMNVRQLLSDPLIVNRDDLQRDLFAHLPR